MTAPTTPTSPVVPPAITLVPSLAPGDTHDGFFLWGAPKAGKSGFIGALAGQALIRVTFSGDTAQKADRWDMGNRIRFVGQGPDGAIYLLEDGSDGRMLRLTPKRS